MAKNQTDRGPVRAVIDCDPGRDDALAILAALGSPELQVDFITTVAGNVSLERATSNALRVLAVAGVDDVPVYAGAGAPLRRPLTPGSTMHGDMAEGDPPLPPARQQVAGDAHEPLGTWCGERSTARKHLIAIGPLTNIAKLLLEDGGALGGVDRLYVMGGTVGQISTRVSDTAEFNFHSDPEAAAIVLGSGMDIRLYDYDATTSCQIPVESVDKVAGSIGGTVGTYVGGWLRHLWEYANRVYGRDGIAVHDLYAALGAAAVQPGRWEWFDITVDVSGERRGTLESTPAEPGSGIAVARDLDAGLMARKLVEYARNLAGTGR